MAALEAVVLNRAPAAVVVVDATGRVAYLNEAAELLYGWSRSEATGRIASELGIQPPESGLPPGLLDTISGGGSWEGELPVRRRDGSSTAVHTSIAPLYDGRGDVLGSISVALAGLASRSSKSGGRRPGQIGRRIAQARRESGLTQQELAEALGVTRRSLQGYEAGTVTPYKHLDRLGEILRRDSEWFLSGDPASQGPQTDTLRAIVRDEITSVLSQVGVVARDADSA